MISKLIRINLFSLLFLLGATAHFVKADHHEQIERQRITFINTTGYPLFVTVKPVTLCFECPTTLQRQTTEHYIDLDKTDEPQVITLTKQTLRVSLPNNNELEFTRVINMCAATTCTIQAIDITEPAECDIDNLQFDATYQINYVDGVLTASLVS